MPTSLTWPQRMKQLMMLRREARRNKHPIQGLGDFTKNRLTPEKSVVTNKAKLKIKDSETLDELRREPNAQRRQLHFGLYLSHVLRRVPTVDELEQAIFDQKMYSEPVGQSGTPFPSRIHRELHRPGLRPGQTQAIEAAGFETPVRTVSIWEAVRCGMSSGASGLLGAKL